MPPKRAKFVFSVLLWYITKPKKSNCKKECISQENISRLFESRNGHFSLTILPPKLEFTIIMDVAISLGMMRLNNFNEGSVEWV